MPLLLCLPPGLTHLLAGTSTLYTMTSDAPSALSSPWADSPVSWDFNPVHNNIRHPFCFVFPLGWLTCWLGLQPCTQWHQTPLLLCPPPGLTYLLAETSTLYTITSDAPSALSSPGLTYLLAETSTLYTITSDAPSALSSPGLTYLLAETSTLYTMTSDAHSALSSPWADLPVSWDFNPVHNDIRCPFCFVLPLGWWLTC